MFAIVTLYVTQDICMKHEGNILAIQESCGVRHALTVVVVDRLLHDAGLRRGDPKRKARLFQAEVEQVLSPVSYLGVV